MTAVAHDFWQEQEDDPVVTVDGRIDFQLEDAYWQSVYWAQPYYRSECSYDEDYAPAYCVGYIGYAQYGGSFDDAEKSLCANWVRIKGDSCLSVEEAMQAVRAAWDHAAQGQLSEDGDEELASAPYAAPATARAGRQPAFA
ncbi:MAG: hypothetical protein K0R58_1208 [Ramlibacter sp.]|jgi:hypothetical protein|nr:hypothetical protein [Ramlibacter sp.]